MMCFRKGRSYLDTVRHDKERGREYGGVEGHLSTIQRDDTYNERFARVSRVSRVSGKRDTMSLD